MTDYIDDVVLSDAELEGEAEAKAAFRRSSAIRQVKEEERAVFGLHDPATYKDRYRAPEIITAASPLGKIFMDGRNKHL